MSERQALIQSTCVCSGSPIKILNSFKLGLTRYTPLCRAPCNGGPELSITIFLFACFAAWPEPEATFAHERRPAFATAPGWNPPGP